MPCGKEIVRDEGRCERRGGLKEKNTRKRNRKAKKKKKNETNTNTKKSENHEGQ